MLLRFNSFDKLCCKRTQGTPYRAQRKVTHLMKYKNETYVRDDANGQFGGKARQVIVDGKSYEIDLSDASFEKIFGIVMERGRLVTS